MGVKTAGIRWSSATTATQRLVVLTHLPLLQHPFFDALE
eukprot:COSAG01_NODE_16316_length_1247_cov_1.133275_1_plen_38_part_10